MEKLPSAKNILFITTDQQHWRTLGEFLQARMETEPMPMPRIAGA